MNKAGKLVIYKDKSGETQLEIKLEKDTLWLTQSQLAQLFRRNQSVISRHIKNIFSENELDAESNMQNLHIANSDKPVTFYSLDVVISVGYRVNSTQGTQFRIWANKVLKQYLLEGYVVNKKLLVESQNKLKELKETINFLNQSIRKAELRGQERELFSVLEYYSGSISVLGKYDSGRLRKVKGKEPVSLLTYKSANEVIRKVKSQLVEKKEASALFGHEIDNRFKAVIGSIYQTFDGRDLYKSVEEKAANILYLIIKDHPFSDGNKRIASILFVYFLEKITIYIKRVGSAKSMTVRLWPLPFWWRAAISKKKKLS